MNRINIFIYFIIYLINYNNYCLSHNYNNQIMNIAIEGCLHGALNKVFDTIEFI